LAALTGTNVSRAGQESVSSPLQHFFDLTSLFLNLAGGVFGFAVSLQPTIVRDLACLLFDFAFHLVKSAFDLVPRTRLHQFSLLIVELPIRVRGRDTTFQALPEQLSPFCNSRPSRPVQQLLTVAIASIIGTSRCDL
jgi:hypothetical protein